MLIKVYEALVMSWLKDEIWKTRNSRKSIRKKRDFLRFDITIQNLFLPAVQTNQLQ
jgi:hypothetical protein